MADLGSAAPDPEIPADSDGTTPPGDGRTWIFLRHGESEANAGNWLSGHVDTPLTALGRQQARDAGALLAPWHLARVVSSDLSRARDTALLALAAWQRATGRTPPPLVQLPALQERHTGEWAGRDRGELRASGELLRLTTWEDGPPGGESQAALAARALPAVASLDAMPVHGPTLVVAHGGVLRILLGVVDGLPHDRVGFFGVPNARPIVRHVSAGLFARSVRALDGPIM